MDNESNPSAYAGRWVARLRGRIIAQAGTPDAALRAAQASRYKERPEVVYMPLDLPLPPLIEKLRALLPDQELYLVGGAVRDMLLGRMSPDLDFAVPDNGTRLARQVANSLDADYMTLDDERDTGRVITRGEDGTRIYLDIAAFRTPEGAQGGDLETDLRGRDFTINAIAYDVRSGVILDPLEGGADLRARRIRACGPTSMKDDPVRILRGVRMAAAFGLQIEPATREQMKRAVGGLEYVSAERLRDELFKILEGPRPDASMRALEILGVLPHVLPELSAMKGVQQSAPHVHDVWNHTLAVLLSLEGILSALRIGYNPEDTEDLFTGLLTLRLGRYRGKLAEHLGTPLNADRSLRALLFFTALFHDVSKPQTRTVEDTGRVRFFGHDQRGADVAARRATDLHLSNDEIERLRVVIREHMRFHFHTSRMEGESREPSRKAIYRFFRDSGAAGPDLVLLGLADLRGTQGNELKQETWNAALDIARILLENYWEKPEESVNPPRLLDGNVLMQELGLEPGPQLGKLIEALREAQAMGKVSSREGALEYARSWLAGSQSRKI